MTPENDLPEAEPAPADFQPERVLPFISYTPQWALFFRRVVVVLLIICGVLAAYILSPVMQTLIVTALLCFLLYLPSRILAARTALNFPCSVMLVYLILIVLIVLGIVALVPSIVNVIQVVGDSLSQLLVRVRDLIEAATPENTVLFIPEANLTIDTWPIISPFKDALSGQIATAVAGVPALDVGAILSTLTSITASLIGSIASIVSSGFLAILLSFLILIDLPRYQNSAAHGIAPIYRREVFLLTGQINNVWSGFFRGQLVICVIIGALTWLQLTLMGIGNATGIAVIVALISLIPTIGGILALIPMFFVPLFTGSTVPALDSLSNGWLALLVTGIYLIWSQIIWTFVAPKILGNAVAIPLPVIILGIGVGLALGGVLGAFLIVPILGSLRIALIYVIHKLNGRDPYPGQGTPDVVNLSTL